MENVEIYCLCDTNNIPFYIGKSKNSKTRILPHKKKFNKKFILEVIDLVPENEWKFWEKWYIQMFKGWGFVLENKNEGGGGNTHLSEKAKESIRTSALNREYLQEWAQKISESNKGKPKNHPPQRGNNISKAKKGIPNPKLKISRTGIPHPKKAWKVKQLDIYFNYIRTFNSAKEAGVFFGRNPQSIRDAASGIQKSAYGFKWEYEREEEN